MHCTSDNKPKIIILAPGRAGDIITSEPIYRKVHLEHPELEVIFVTRKEYADIMEHAPYISRTVILSEKSEFEEYAAKFPAGTHIIRINLPTGKPEPGYVRDGYGNTYSLLNRSQYVNDLPMDNDDPVFYLADGTALPEGLPEKYVVFHCCSGGRARQWQPEKFRALAMECIERGIGVVEIGFGSVLEIPHPLFVPLCGSRPMQELAVTIKNAVALVGIESSMAHIANCFHVPGFIVQGKLGDLPWYNLYCGMYGRMENLNVMRFYNSHPADMPLVPAMFVFRQFLDGKPLSYQECDSYFLRAQLQIIESRWYNRLLAKIMEPVKRIQASLLFDRRPKRKKQ